MLRNHWKSKVLLKEPDWMNTWVMCPALNTVSYVVKLERSELLYFLGHIIHWQASLPFDFPISFTSKLPFFPLRLSLSFLFNFLQRLPFLLVSLFLSLSFWGSTEKLPEKLLFMWAVTNIPEEYSKITVMERVPKDHIFWAKKIKKYFMLFSVHFWFYGGSLWGFFAQGPLQSWVPTLLTTDAGFVGSATSVTTTPHPNIPHSNSSIYFSDQFAGMGMNKVEQSSKFSEYNIDKKPVTEHSIEFPKSALRGRLLGLSLWMKTEV